MKAKINTILEKIKKIDKKEILTIVLILVGLVSLYFLPRLIININAGLPEVKLKNMQNNGMLAIMVPDDENAGKYKEYTGPEFPKGHKLNTDKSYCIDRDGQEVKNSVSMGNLGGVKIRTNKEVYCTLYYDYPPAELLIYDNSIKNLSNCGTVQCALDELYTVLH